MLCFLLVPLYASTRTPSKRKRRQPQHIKHIRNTRVSWIPTFDEPCSLTLHPLNFVTVVFLVWVPNSGTILHRRAKQRKVSSLLKLLWAALQVAMQKWKLRVSLVCLGCNVFWPLQVVTESYPKVLSVHDFLQYLSCQWVVEKVRVTGPWHLAALKHIPHVLYLIVVLLHIIINSHLPGSSQQSGEARHPTTSTITGNHNYIIFILLCYVGGIRTHGLWLR